MLFGYCSAPADVECDQLLPAEPQRGGHHDGHPQHLRLLHLHAGQVAGKIFSDGVKIFVFRVWHFGSVYCIINQFISLTTVGVTCSLHCPHTNTVWRLQENIQYEALHSYNIYTLSYLSASQF